MIYLIFGQNSLEMSKKVREIKTAFFSARSGSESGGKNPNFLIEEVNGDEEETQEFGALLKARSLFLQKRFVIFKNAFPKIYTAEILKKYTKFLKESKDIFLFCENNLKREDKIFKIFEENSQKVQEVKMSPKEEPVFLANSVFKFTDKIFASSGAESLLALEGARKMGVESRSLINVIFWKIKKMQKRDLHALNIAHKAILTDLNLKMDFQNESEHLSRLAIRVASRV